MDMMAALTDHGMLLQSARGPIPNVAELVAGDRINGSWWSHAKSHEIFTALGQLDDSPDVVRLRLVNGKVTFVHRRLWPALVRLADRFTPPQLVALHEQHTASGAHKVVGQPFPEWVPKGVVRAAQELSIEQALAQMPACLRGLDAR
ncbi:MAG: hypothetical protein ABI658_32040 [Acidimicrobiales bacterium]